MPVSYNIRQLYDDLGNQQKDAFGKVMAWLDGHRHGDHRRQVFRLFGYAGTGKTYLARIIALAQPYPERVRAAAFSNKAAYVLQRKGFDKPDLKPATTIHHLVAKRQGSPLAGDLEDVVPIEGKHEKRQQQNENTAKPVFNLGGNVNRTDLFILDECSMIGRDLGQALLNLGRPILVLGDPAQLPPIQGVGFFTSGKGDVTLTEPQRTNSDSAILDVAMAYRMRWDGNATTPLPAYGATRDTLILPQRGLTTDVLHRFTARDSIILTPYNTTRYMLNWWARKRLFETGDLPGSFDWCPVPGDKLISVKTDLGGDILNGSLWTVLQATNAVTVKTETPMVILDLEEQIDGIVGRRITVTVQAKYFDMVNIDRDELYPQFTYGYAITTHKAQGSEWNNVLVVDQSWAWAKYVANNEQERWRWLYTAATRASKHLTVVPDWRRDFAPEDVLQQLGRKRTTRP